MTPKRIGLQYPPLTKDKKGAILESIERPAIRWDHQAIAFIFVDRWFFSVVKST